MPPSPNTRVVTTRGARSRTLARDGAASPDRLRAAVRNFAAEQGITIGELARRMKLKNANAFYNFLNGRSSSLSTATLLRICDSFPGTTLDHLVGRERRQVDRVPAPAIAEAVIAAPEPAKTGPVIGAALEELTRSLQALRVATEIVERDLLRTAAALSTSTRPSGPA